MGDQKKDDDSTTLVPEPERDQNDNPDANSSLQEIDPPDVRIVWGKEGERPRIFMSSAARERSIARTIEIRLQEHGRDFRSPFDSGESSEGTEGTDKD